MADRIKSNHVKAFPVDYGKENTPESLQKKTRVRVSPVNEKYEINLVGISETADFVDTYYSIWEGFNAALADNELTVADIVHFSSAVMNLFSALNGASAVLGELKDLTYEEKGKLLKRADKFDLGSYYQQAFSTLDGILSGIRVFNAYSVSPKSSIDKNSISTDSKFGGGRGNTDD